jgi:poly(3-hydroxybutyrate) depolymerase
VPILFVHGRADTVVPPGLVAAAVSWWAVADGCGPATADAGCARYGGCRADVVDCEGPQGHSWPPDATARIWRFFRDHPRP